MAKLPSPADVAQMLFRCRRTWLPAVFPHGRIEGNKFLLGDCYGSPGDSLPIPFDSQPRVSDFGSDWSGDDLDLYGRGRGHEDNEKAAWLDAAGFLGLTDERQSVGRPTPERPERSRYVPGTNENIDVGYEPPGSPIPNGEIATGAELATGNGHARGRHETNPSWGQEVGSWTFLTAEGEPWVDAVRFESGEVKNGKAKKAFHHYLWPAQAWVQGKILIPKPMLLFGLPDLLARPKDPVLVVGGEKCAEAAIDMGYLATANVSGEGAVKYADLRPLAGRTVTVWRDNDSKGEVWQADLLAGLAKLKPAVTVKIVQPPEDAPDGWDIADAVDPESGWTGEQVRALVDEAQEPELPPGDARPFKLMDWPSKQGLDPPPQEFIVDRLIPVGTVTALFGLGGIGKTLLAQLLATCCNVGQDFLGIPTRHCRAMTVLCEDPEVEVWRRQARINYLLGVEMRALAELLTEVRLGEANKLAVFDPRTGALKDGPFMPVLLQALDRLKPELLILDNILQIYGGPLNDPGIVTEFVGKMARVAIDHHCTILMLGHVSKAPGSAFMGTQSWSDSVRSRLLLEAEENVDDRNEAAKIFLSRPKANYAIGDKDRVELRWESGLLVPAQQRARTYGDKLDRQMRAGEIRQIFLDALDALTERGKNISENPGANYAPRVIYDLGMAKDATIQELKAAMNKLVGDGVLLVNRPIGRREDNRNIKYGLARAYPRVLV